MKKQEFDKVHRTLCGQLGKMIRLICERNELLEDIYEEGAKEKPNKEQQLGLSDALQQNFFELGDTWEDMNDVFGDHIGVTDTIFFIDDVKELIQDEKEDIDKKIQNALGNSEDESK
jgi:hypothetical protein